jgi:hypothetical protein
MDGAVHGPIDIVIHITGDGEGQIAQTSIELLCNSAALWRG